MKAICVRILISHRPFSSHTTGAHLLDIHVLGNRLSDNVAITVDDVYDTGRESGLGDELGHEDRRERRELRRLENDGVTGGERGAKLPREHQD